MDPLDPPLAYNTYFSPNLTAPVSEIPLTLALRSDHAVTENRQSYLRSTKST